MFLPIAILRKHVYRHQLIAEFNVITRVFDELSPLVVFLPGDRELSPVPPVLAAAKKNDIVTVIGTSSLPYVEGVAVSRSNQLPFKADKNFATPLINILASFCFPGQVAKSKFGKQLFSPGWRVFALSSTGMLSQNPWVQGGGLSNFIVQYSKKQAQHYLDLGVPENKLLFLGDINLDPVYNTFRDRIKLRQELEQKYGLSDSLPLIVMAVPNEAEHNLCDWDVHLQRQESFWSRIAAHKANVLLCLHPKSSRNSYELLAQKFGFLIVDKELSATLPLADLFVCGGSTTVQWAKLCGVPVINMDYLDLDIDLFKEPVGITQVRTPEEFSVALKNWFHNRTSKGIIN